MFPVNFSLKTKVIIYIDKYVLCPFLIIRVLYSVNASYIRCYRLSLRDNLCYNLRAMKLARALGFAIAHSSDFSLLHFTVLTSLALP